MKSSVRRLAAIKYFWFMLLAFSAPQAVVADTINLRLIAGIASVDTNYDFSGQNEKGQNWQVQLMQYFPEGSYPHAWGLELGHFSVLNSDVGELSYDTISFFVESSPFKTIKWFRTNIGTSGYFGDGLSDNKTFGLRVGFGAEVPIDDRFRLVGFIRRDSIFDEEKSSFYSLQLGVQGRLR